MTISNGFIQAEAAVRRLEEYCQRPPKLDARAPILVVEARPPTMEQSIAPGADHLLIETPAPMQEELSIGIETTNNSQTVEIPEAVIFPKDGSYPLARPSVSVPIGAVGDDSESFNGDKPPFYVRAFSRIAAKVLKIFS